jgi:hypothetical protein
MLTILVFERKEGKDAQKVINHNLSLRIRERPPACMLKKAL